MGKNCPECGKPIETETQTYCNTCNAEFTGTSPIGQKESAQPTHEEKSTFLALVCSIFIPGLGQVYNGESSKGAVILFGTAIGVVIFIVPGLIVWIFGIYDAYATANKMNKGEIPFKPTIPSHLILFFVLRFSYSLLRSSFLPSSYLLHFFHSCLQVSTDT